MRLVEKIKQQGLLHLVETSFNRIVPAWLFRFSVGEVLELDLIQLQTLASSTDGSNGSYQFATVATEPDKSLLRAVTFNSVPVETTMHDIGYAARRKDDSAIVGGVWIGADDFLESNLGFQIQLQPNQAWLYCASIDKSVRGRGIYTRLLSEVAKDVLQRGYDQLLVVIQPWNKASMHVHGKYIQQHVGRIIAIRILRWMHVHSSGGMSQDKRLTTQPTHNPIQITIPSNRHTTSQKEQLAPP